MPARLAVADYMVERGDVHGALQWLSAATGTDGKLGYAAARLHLACGNAFTVRAMLDDVVRH